MATLSSAVPLAISPPPDVAASGAIGVSTNAAREDHTHGHGNQAGGSLHALAVPSGAAGFLSGVDAQVLADIATTYTPQTRTLTAGDGLTGGGDLSVDRTFNVVAGDGTIIANANDIVVGTVPFTQISGTLSDTQHGSRAGGSLHALAVPLGAAGFLSGADKDKLDNIAAGASATWTGLTDTPGSITAGNVYRGNAGGTAFEAIPGLVTPSASGNALLGLTSTTQGFQVMSMTTAQRTAIATVAGDAGLIVFDSDLGHIHQWTGSAWTIPGAGLTTLQGAYNNAPSSAQIVLNGTPDPIMIQASVAGLVFEARDVTANPILSVNANPDTITARAGVTIDNAFLNAAAANSLVITQTFTTGGSFIGGGILSSGTVTYNSPVFIWALLQESKTYLAASGPGFAAFTLFNALSVIENSGNFNLVQALVLNVGVVHRRNSSGTSTVTQTIGLSFAAQTAASASGAVMTRTTGLTAVSVAPTMNTVAGSTVNLGTIRGILFAQPAVALFGSLAGIENMTAYYGIDFPDMTFGGASATYSVIRSALNTGTNKRFLDHVGNAPSRLRGHLQFDVDAFGVILGASLDVLMRWQAAGHLSYFGFGTSSDLQISTPGAANRFLFNTAGGSTTGEMNFNVLKFSLGAQLGAVGNQKGVFVAGAETVTIAGEFSQFLLTQAGNDTLSTGGVFGGYYGWTINCPTPLLGTSTGLTNAGALNIGGNPGIGDNRFGLRILSNPSGGLGINAALWVTVGNTQLGGDLTHTGTNIGLYGATPIAQGADPVALTDSTGGIANNTVAAVTGTGDDVTINDNFADLTAKYNALRALLSEAAGGIGIAA